MNQRKNESGFDWRLLLLPLKIILWPLAALGRWTWEHWFSYVFGRVLRDRDRIYSIRFVWYGDSIYLHPMVWGSVILYVVVKSGVFSPGWPLFIWFLLLAFCFFTVIYNFDILKGSVLVVCVIAVLSLAYVANLEWEWNVLGGVVNHVKSLNAGVEPGFYIVAAYVFGILIVAEVLWAWLFNRVEIDESYVYERKFLQSSTRDPIFARGLKRETKDLLELIIMGAADITHRTRSGFKTFKNVPGASLGLGRAIDDMLDHRRPGEVELERQRRQQGATMTMDDAPPDGFEEG
ncbi:MAG: hypothetical protein ACQESR_18605 [Planctomycetota bacterium]